ncbi:unnamed protein product, partial [Musa acuminata subsp. burmannicoides]
MGWFVPFGIAYHSCMMIVLSNNINTRETAHAIRKLPLAKAKRYPEDGSYVSSPCHIELSLSEKGRDHQERAGSSNCCQQAQES